MMLPKRCCNETSVPQLRLFPSFCSPQARIFISEDGPDQLTFPTPYRRPTGTTAVSHACAHLWAYYRSANRLCCPIFRANHSLPWSCPERRLARRIMCTDLELFPCTDSCQEEESTVETRKLMHMPTAQDVMSSGRNS